MLLDGKKIAEHSLDKIKEKVAELPFVPVFCDILVGSDPVSLSYVQVKGRAAERVGMKFRLVQLPENSLESSVLREIQSLNGQHDVRGIIVQLPLPDGMNRQKILDSISPEKDVDCLGSRNTREFYHGTPKFLPPTAAAILELLGEVPESIRKGNIVVIGQGMLVGKPIARLLRNQGLKVTVADKQTPDLAALALTADVLICGTGQPCVITGDMVKPGAAVIDAGTAEMEGGIVGDVDMRSVSHVAGFVSPVPGGVGPVTVAKLIENVYKSSL